MSRTLETFDVEEKPSAAVESQCPNVRVVQAVVIALHAEEKVMQFTGCSQGFCCRYVHVCKIHRLDNISITLIRYFILTWGIIDELGQGDSHDSKLGWTVQNYNPSLLLIS